MSSVVGSLAVELRADVATFRSDMGKASQVAASEARRMEAAMRENSKRAKDSLDLLGDTIGIRIPRELKKVVASSSTIAPALSAAFSGAAIATGIMVMSEFVAKIGDVTDGFFGLTEEVKKLGKEFESKNWQTFLKTLDSSAKSIKALQEIQKKQAGVSSVRDFPLMGGVNLGGDLTIAAAQIYSNYKLAGDATKEFTENLSRADDIQETLKTNTEKESEARKKAADDAERQLEAFLKQRAESEKLFATFPGRSIKNLLGLDPDKALKGAVELGNTLESLNKTLGTGDSAEGRESLKEAIAGPFLVVNQLAPRTNSLISELGINLRQARDIGVSVGHDLSSSFADAVVNLQGMRQVLVGLLQDIARQLIEMSTSRLFGGLFQSLLGGLFSVGVPTIGNGVFNTLGPAPNLPIALSGVDFGGLPHFAEGGRYGAGPMLVGEHGPELMIPDGSGMVIPNHKLGNGGGDSITQVFHFPPGVNPIMLKTWGESIKKDAAKLAVATVVDRQKRRKIG